MEKSRKIGLIIGGVVIVIVAFVIVELTTHVIGKWVNSTVYDNRVHYVSCEKLPALSEVESLMEEHQDVIQQIEDIHPGFTKVNVDSSCPGKGSLVIEYASHEDRTQIEALIGDTFFGVPWKGINL
jgi:hypothetical protein